MFQWSERPRALRIGCYGPTRSGKTHFAASAPRPCFIVPQNENSEVTFAGRQRSDGTPFPIKKVSRRDDVNATLDYLLALSKRGQIHQLCDTVVFDSLSHYSECVEMELTQSGQSQMSGQWGLLTSHFKHIKDVLWQLDCHVIICALDFIRSNKSGVVEQCGAKLPGGIGQHLFSSVDVLAYFEQVQVQTGQGSQIYWQAHLCKKPPFDAGSRIPGMPAAVIPWFNWEQHIAPFVGSGPMAADARPARPNGGAA
jgi:hypothetical protein